MLMLDEDTLHAVATGRLRLATPRDEDEIVEAEVAWMKRVAGPGPRIAHLLHPEPRMSYSYLIEAVTYHPRGERWPRGPFVHNDLESLKGRAILPLTWHGRRRWHLEHLHRALASQARLPLATVRLLAWGGVMELAIKVHGEHAKRRSEHIAAIEHAFALAQSTLQIVAGAIDRGEMVSPSLIGPQVNA